MVEHRTGEPARKILVADEEEDVRNLVRYALQRDGHEVIPVSDGAEALDHARELRPDLCVLGVMLPKLGGVEVLKELRGDPDLADVKVILLTSRAQGFDLTRGFDAGADDYVIKPFSPDELRQRVLTVLG